MALACLIQPIAANFYLIDSTAIQKRLAKFLRPEVLSKNGPSTNLKTRKKFCLGSEKKTKK